MSVNTRASINAKKHNKHYYYYLCLVEITLFSIINKQRHHNTTPEAIHISNLIVVNNTHAGAPCPGAANSH